MNDLPADQATLKATLIPAASIRTHWFSHVIKPHVLFPAIAVITLTAIWGTTLNLINIERTAAEQIATRLSYELTQTYESKVVRAPREIDQTHC